MRTMFSDKFKYKFWILFLEENFFSKIGIFDKKNFYSKPDLSYCDRFPLIEQLYFGFNQYLGGHTSLSDLSSGADKRG